MSSPLRAEPKLVDKNLITFEIQPKICIAKEVGDACAMTVKLKWQTFEPMKLCLAQNKKTLKCWQQNTLVEDMIAIEVEEQSEFTLTEQGSGLIVAKQSVKINYQVNKRYRRRLRSEWSIF